MERVPTIAGEFTRESYKRFRARYERAVRDHEHEFEFDGREFVTDFAKYVGEYLDLKFGKESS